MEIQSYGRGHWVEEFPRWKNKHREGSHGKVRAHFDIMNIQIDQGFPIKGNNHKNCFVLWEGDVIKSTLQKT